MRMVAVSVLIMLSLMSCEATYTPPDGALDTKDNVIERLIQSEHEIRDVTAQVTVSVPEEGANPFYVITWGYKGGKEFVAGEKILRSATKPGTELHDNFKYAYDGSKMRIMSHILEEGDRITGRIAPLEEETFCSLPGVTDLLGFDIKYAGRMTMGESLRGAESVHVTLQKNDRGGPIYLVEAEHVEYDEERNVWFNARIWLDPQKDYRPTRVEKLYAAGGEYKWVIPHQVVSNIVLKNIDGIWFPVSGTYQHFRPVFSAPPGMTDEAYKALSAEERWNQAIIEVKPVVAPRFINVDPSSIHINQGVDDSLFSINFPDGARIWDDYSQTGYVVGLDNRQGSEDLDSGLK